MSIEQAAWTLYQVPGKAGMWCLNHHRHKLANLIEKLSDNCGWTNLFYKLYQIAKKS
jgi:hypothetical protein